MKKCFNCKLTLPLFLFHKRTGKYMRPSDKGRGHCCRFCNLRFALRGSVVRKINGKFQVVNLTVAQAVKEFFK